MEGGRERGDMDFFSGGWLWAAYLPVCPLYSFSVWGRFSGLGLVCLCFVFFSSQRPLIGLGSLSYQAARTVSTAWEFSYLAYQHGWGLLSVCLLWC